MSITSNLSTSILKKLNNMYNTFNGWKRHGRVVASGERGCYRNEYGDMMYHVGKTVPRGSNLVPIRTRTKVVVVESYPIQRFANCMSNY